MPEEKILFRSVFNKKLVERLAAGIKKVYRQFDDHNFIAEINDQLAELSFGERSTLIRDKLAQFLPEDLPKAVSILVKALDPEPEADDLSGSVGFVIMPQCDFIAKYGIDFPDESLNALYEMTKRFTAEEQIRPFIRKYPEKTMDFLKKLATDPSPFARRLVSEGTRPRLPLGSRLHEFIKDPGPVITLLDKLKSDTNLMVRRSVANNINDIAKDNPEIAVATLKRWSKDKSPETKWLIKHAARTLLKQGNKGALELLGYTPKPEASITGFKIARDQFKIGEALQFSFLLKSISEKKQNLMIDYAIHFVKANGKTKPKVFKLAAKKLLPGETVLLCKAHSLKQFTTRVHYPGKHIIEIFVNGDSHLRKNFFVSG